MRVQEAEDLAYLLMDRYALFGWQIVWVDWMDKAGQCIRPYKWILLSRPFVEVNGEGEVREIITHEIAHALTVGGHEEDWVAVHQAMGGTGDECPVLQIPLHPPLNERYEVHMAVAVDDGREWERRVGD